MSNSETHREYLITLLSKRQYPVDVKTLVREMRARGWLDPTQSRRTHYSVVRTTLERGAGKVFKQVESGGYRLLRPGEFN